MKGFTIAGISTEVGKTLASAMLVEGLEADYWKPVQAGDLIFSDTEKVRGWVGNAKSFFHPEAYRLTRPMSPHAAAAKDRMEIQLSRIRIPKTHNTLIVELAGGVMVPLNNTQTNINLIEHIAWPVILVANYYLGSINHTLLTIEALKNLNVELAGIIFNGKVVPSTREFILNYACIDLIGEIPYIPTINAQAIYNYGRRLALKLKDKYDD